MDALVLARLQFAVTTSFHFLFVLLTLGLVTLVAITQTRAHRRGDPVLWRMTRFWGHLYVINYAVGIATGIVMEFQFGLNWSGLSAFAGDVFGAPLAVETLVAFFLESTFLGLWIFGWDRLSPRLHLALIWLVALTAYASALWIMSANAFLQHPVGYELSDGVLRLTDFGALLSNPTFGSALLHVLTAALLTGGVVMAGISAWHLLRGTAETEFFRRSMRQGVIAAAVSAPFVVGAGIAQFPIINELQPDKLGEDTGALGIPLALMMNIGVVLLITNLVLAHMRRRQPRWALWLAVLAIPWPFVAAISGWVFREVGRQPWLVYGLLRTEDAASQTDPTMMLLSFVAFTAMFAALAFLDWRLLAKVARRGPVSTPEFVPQEVRAW
ncbi:cytochrome ubiquinol oxidase subunit I [Actinokineospora fastidiosa]|uniref:Cytochrome ubiquinol oxidase subunit I n=1 Tax=Actinokineospora fastidiosa TaxID=1816 RepID=A0A918G231_9PSEU|nr:cytochrome ubiquinol oxidase subunit I [Actinokineospora fastidiosa]GGS13453.1 cytochrome ubiquinol oxidase subunit I [Actinokineospora fastidiosa]